MGPYLKGQVTDPPRPTQCAMIGWLIYYTVVIVDSLHVISAGISTKLVEESLLGLIIFGSRTPWTSQQDSFNGRNPCHRHATNSPTSPHQIKGTEPRNAPQKTSETPHLLPSSSDTHREKLSHFLPFAFSSMLSVEAGKLPSPVLLPSPKLAVRLHGEPTRWFRPTRAASGDSDLHGHTDHLLHPGNALYMLLPVL